MKMNSSHEISKVISPKIAESTTHDRMSQCTYPRHNARKVRQWLIKQFAGTRPLVMCCALHALQFWLTWPFLCVFISKIICRYVLIWKLQRNSYSLVELFKALFSPCLWTSLSQLVDGPLCVQRILYKCLSTFKWFVHKMTPWSNTYRHRILRTNDKWLVEQFSIRHLVLFHTVLYGMFMKIIISCFKTHLNSMNNIRSNNYCMSNHIGGVVLVFGPYTK